MKQISLDDRVAALERLQVEVASGRYQASQRLSAIDRLLFWDADFCESDLHRILKKAEYAPPIARSIELYVMMARLTQICEPKGSAIGPSCAVSLIDFERLTQAGVLDVKGAAGFGLFFRLPDPGMVNKAETEFSSKFNALNLLSAEQKNLYHRAKPFFVGQKKPTLKSLAASLLKEQGHKGYSERSLSRYIRAIRDFKFADQDIRLAMVIQAVEGFGEDDWSMRQMYAECYPHLVTAVRRAITSAATSFIPFITQMLLLPPASKGSQN